MFKKSNGVTSRPVAEKQISVATASAARVQPLAQTQAAGKLAYEQRRAAKAGVSLDRWMADKQKRVQAELDAERRARAKTQPPAKPGFLKRLLDRAHKPL